MRCKVMQNPKTDCKWIAVAGAPRGSRPCTTNRIKFHDSRRSHGLRLGFKLRGSHTSQRWTIRAQASERGSCWAGSRFSLVSSLIWTTNTISSRMRQTCSVSGVTCREFARIVFAAFHPRLHSGRCDGRSSVIFEPSGFTVRSLDVRCTFSGKFGCIGRKLPSAVRDLVKPPLGPVL